MDNFANVQKLEIAFFVIMNIREAMGFLCFQIAVSMLTYPFLLVGDLMAVNNCGYVRHTEI